MTIVFKAKTREGFSLKTLAELLQNNIKTACFEIDKNGIKLRMMDHHRTILIDLELDANNFAIYIFKYKDNDKLFIGINLTHFHKMLKTVKKKDSVKLFIDDKFPTDLGIKIIPKENNRVTTSFIKIQTIQNLDIDIPTGYGKPVIVPSGEFQKMCKGLSHISNITKIKSKGFSIQFASDAGGVMKRTTDFGETEDSDLETEDQDIQDNEYSEDFDTEQLSKINKISGFSQNMQIYTKNNNPLLFRSQIGSIGKISIYLKSKTLQQIENNSHPNEDENHNED
jgi:proliferating cell nuclear antigen PCNA